MAKKNSFVMSSPRAKRLPEERSRRDFLGQAGLAAGIMMISGQQPPSRTAGSGGQAATTQIDQLLRLNRDQVSKLTASARQLTKGDLQALGRGDLAASRRASNLTISDLKSLVEVMAEIAGPSARLRKEGGGIIINCCDASTSSARAINCCSCCCCCCCAVAMRPAHAIV